MSLRPRLLAVDCATIPASIALLDGDVTVCELVHDDDRRADAWLGTAIERCLAESGVEFDGLDGFAAAVGPGAFTGIRVGIATCLGLAAPLGLPVAGVRTLDALATIGRAASDVVAACIDARRGQVYAALYGPEADEFSLPILPLWGPQVCDPEEFARRLATQAPGALVCGSGAPLIAAHGEIRIAGDVLPLAAALGSLASRAWTGDGEQRRWPPPAPVYLRPPDARPPRNPLRDRRPQGSI